MSIVAPTDVKPLLGRLPASVPERLAELGYEIGDPERLKIAFVGQATYFEICAPEPQAEWAEVSFIDHRAGADYTKIIEELLAIDPDVVVVFRPELVPEGLFSGLKAVTLGYLTEPLPRSPKDKHKDLKRRLSYLKPMDPGNFDRIVSFDPLIADTASDLAPIWRSAPLPVSDAVYSEPKFQQEAQPIFIGRSTKHREKYLGSIKHEYDILHIAHGLDMKGLLDLFEKSSISVNLHNKKYPSFENRVSLHLAAGHLVISEPLSPTHGLEPGIDYIEISDPEELFRAVTQAIDNPKAFLKLRSRGRQKAELFRASRVYPRLLFDLLNDLAAFGTERAD